MRSIGIWSFVMFMLVSGNLIAAGTSPDKGDLLGKWVTGCRYQEHSDPTDPNKGTYQKIFWNFSNATLSIHVAIHGDNDKSCKQKTIYDAKGKYQYKLDGGSTLSDGKKVTKISGTVIGENMLFDPNMKDVLYLNSGKLYIGSEPDEMIGGFPDAIEEAFHFKKM